MTLVGHRVFVAREGGRYRVYLAADRSEGGVLQPCHAVVGEDGSLVWGDHPQGGRMEPLEVALFGNVQVGGEVVGDLFEGEAGRRLPWSWDA